MKKIYAYICLILLASGWMACSKVEKGYLNNQIYYKNSPAVIIQGRTFQTGAIAFAGSTPPFYDAVIVAVRNSITGERADDLFLKKVPLLIWSKPKPAKITQEFLDNYTSLQEWPLTYIDKANANITILSNNFHIPMDSVYEFDVKVRNVAGEKLYKNIFQAKFVKGEAYEKNPGRYWGTGIQNGTANTIKDLPIDVPIDFVEDGKNKIRLVVLDKNGQRFDPRNGEIIFFPARASLHDKAIAVDTLPDGTLEFEYGGISPFLNLEALTYRIPARFMKEPYSSQAALNTKRGADVNLEFKMKLWTTPGSYNVTLRNPIFEREPNPLNFMSEGRTWATNAAGTNTVADVELPRPFIQYKDDGQHKIRLTIVDRNGVPFDPRNAEFRSFGTRVTLAGLIPANKRDTLPNGTIEYDYDNNLSLFNYQTITYQVMNTMLKDTRYFSNIEFRMELYKAGSYDIRLVSAFSEHK